MGCESAGESTTTQQFGMVDGLMQELDLSVGHPTVSTRIELIGGAGPCSCGPRFAPHPGAQPVGPAHEILKFATYLTRYLTSSQAAS